MRAHMPVFWNRNLKSSAQIFQVKVSISKWYRLLAAVIVKKLGTGKDIWMIFEVSLVFTCKSVTMSLYSLTSLSKWNLLKQVIIDYCCFLYIWASNFGHLFMHLERDNAEQRFQPMIMAETRCQTTNLRVKSPIR